MKILNKKGLNSLSAESEFTVAEIIALPAALVCVIAFVFLLGTAGDWIYEYHASNQEFMNAIYRIKWSFLFQLIKK